MYQPRVLENSKEPDGAWMLAIIHPDADDLAYDAYQTALDAGLEFCEETDIPTKDLYIAVLPATVGIFPYRD